MEVCLSSGPTTCTSSTILRNGQVPEHLTVLCYENEIRWHRLSDGKYQLQPPDADGIWRSRVFPGLWLDGEALLARDMPQVIEAIARGHPVAGTPRVCRSIGCQQGSAESRQRLILLIAPEFSRPLHFKQVGCAAVPVGPKTSNGLKFARIDAAVRRQHVVSDVHQEYFAYHEVGRHRTIADGTIWITRHSMWTGLATRGGFTLIGWNEFQLGQVGFAFAAGQFAGGEVDLVSQRRDGGVEHEFAVASTFSRVSFFEPSRRETGEKTTAGGLAPKALKKLNGARLMRPCASTVVAQAIGRGVTTSVSKR